MYVQHIYYFSDDDSINYLDAPEIELPRIFWNIRLFFVFCDEIFNSEIKESSVNETIKYNLISTLLTDKLRTERAVKYFKHAYDEGFIIIENGRLKLNPDKINKSAFAYLCEYIYVKNDSGTLLHNAKFPATDINKVFGIKRIDVSLYKIYGESNCKTSTPPEIRYKQIIDLIKRCK